MVLRSIGECWCRRHTVGMARWAVRSQRSSIRCARRDDMLGPMPAGLRVVAGTGFDTAHATNPRLAVA